MDRGVWQATVRGVARVRHNLATRERTYFTKLLLFFQIKMIRLAHDAKPNAFPTQLQIMYLSDIYK